MKYKVFTTESADLDLLDIHLYIELNDSPERADDVLDGIEEKIAGLSNMPEKGHHPQELARIGVHNFREIHYKPYRIIYSIQDSSVVVNCVLDSRRDMQTLLQQRLVR